MLTDDNPAVWHSDEYIREWARQRGKDKLPQVDIELDGAITSDTKDIARIYWDSEGLIIRRCSNKKFKGGHYE